MGIWLSKEQYELFVKIVDDKNYDSHESTNEPMEYVKPWSCEALDRIELFAKSANGSLQEDHYKEYFEEDFGAQAAAALAPLMAAVDTANAWEGPQSPEYFAFRPDWGVLDEANAASRQGIIDAIDAVLNFEEHDYLFFCARATFDGYHNFARTLREHNANARAYSAELNRRKIK